MVHDDISVRPWDPACQYEAGFVRRYEHWTVEISHKQHTLGCAILFCNRSVIFFEELDTAELTELRDIVAMMKKTVYAEAPFDAIRLNILQMGNTTSHLHFHIVPRYTSNRKWGGVSWIDTDSTQPVVWQNDLCKESLVRELVIYFTAKIKK
jgi:diadenosine tetraphosphate (Ap4A) HIT family hydrolase